MRIPRQNIHTPKNQVTQSVGPKLTIKEVTQTELRLMKLATHSTLLAMVTAIIGTGFGAYYMWSTELIDAKGLTNIPNQVISVVAPDQEKVAEQEQVVAVDQGTVQDEEIIDNLLPLLIKEHHREPTQEELVRAEEKVKLSNYLAKWKSPFAKDDLALEAFLDSNNMNLMLAIAFVESSMGKKCYYNNCSGIGGYPPNLRKYATRADWIRDFDSLLERKYKGVPVEKFMGRYVQPGSPNWINGVKQILAELEQAGIS